MFYDWTGALTYVAIDDRIPVKDYRLPKWKGEAQQKQYQFIMNEPSPDGAYWLVILEKAFAKLNVNYINLTAGLPGDALRSMTGMPVVTYIS